MVYVYIVEVHVISQLGRGFCMFLEAHLLCWGRTKSWFIERPESICNR